MGDVSYRPLIEDMTWSYSRVNSFDSCKYAWYLKYIYGMKESERFFSSYGSFMHKLIELYYRGKITKQEMLTKFCTEFSDNVVGERPEGKILNSYINNSIEYLQGFEPFPFNMIDVEKKVKFEVCGKKFIGIIDYIGEKDGELYIVDNKSRKLRPRSGKLKPTKGDLELDEMLKQLYIYSFAVEQEYGKLPAGLCINCFRNNLFIEEPFVMEDYEAAQKWIINKIKEIGEEEEFYPNVDYFFCKWLCGCTEECEAYEMNFGRRGRGAY